MIAKRIWKEKSSPFFLGVSVGMLCTLGMILIKAEHHAHARTMKVTCTDGTKLAYNYRQVMMMPLSEIIAKCNSDKTSQEG